MVFWKKLFGTSKKDKAEPLESKFLPEKKQEVDTLFASKFTHMGGKFLYSENSKSTDEYFNLILEENHWRSENLLCFNEQLRHRFGVESPSSTSNPKDYKALLIGCEYLIANKGTILICNHQIKDLKLHQLPDFIIVFSNLNNFVNDVSEGMSKLKNKYIDKVPSNITTLNVKNAKDENDFLSYGSSAKNLYLILQED